MIHFTAEERQQLVEILVGIPDFQTQDGRLAVLQFAGLGQIALHIDLGGSPFIAANRVVEHLLAYGRTSRDHEALGVLLNGVKQLTGVEQQSVLSGLILRHRMTVPLSDLPPIPTWNGASGDAIVFEKIVLENTLRPIAFLGQALRASRAVAFLDVRSGAKQWSGTGFLLSEKLLLTNAHVLPYRELLKNTVFRFNYEDDDSGDPLPVTDVRASPSGVFHVNADLDYAIVELEGDPGEEWGWLPWSEKPPELGQRVNIVQHAGGGPKQIAMQANFVEYADSRVVQYVTPTLPGSSGSPVLNDSWQVCSLHHAGGNLPEPATGLRYFRNEGIVMAAILDDLPLAVRGFLHS